MIIYKATNIKNGKCYIGKFHGNLNKRISTHLKSSLKPIYYFHRAIAKHNFNSFIWEIIDTAKSGEELKKLEILHIKNFNSLAPNGYNMTKGGDGILGYSHSNETKQKISNHFKGKKIFNRKKPIPVSDETRKKLSETSKARLRSIETRLKNSLANKGRKHKPWTEERRIKMKQIHKDRWIKLKNIVV